MDWSAVLLDPIYATLGVEASLAPATGPAVTVTAIDKTVGVAAVLEVGGVEVETVRPAAALRMAELTEAGVDHANLDDGEITFNGKTWRIANHQLRPSPGGELAGEVLLLLMDGDVG